MRRFLLLPSMVLAFAVPAAAQVTVGSAPADAAVGQLGVDSQNAGFIPTAIAQTFFAPPGQSYLQSFTFFLSSFANGGDLKLNASIYAFSADHLIGSALFTSPFNGTDNEAPTVAEFDSHTVGGDPSAPLNILLSPGSVYALVLSAFDGNTTRLIHRQCSLARLRTTPTPAVRSLSRSRQTRRRCSGTAHSSPIRALADRTWRSTRRSRPRRGRDAGTGDADVDGHGLGRRRSLRQAPPPPVRVIGGAPRLCRAKARRESRRAFHMIEFASVAERFG